ncbi:MAG: C2 domain-containing protein [Thermodesulfobacteriota bacterium]|nr:C2 domain-containing protein [Thermodesulfobacteriota bacterium]
MKQRQPTFPESFLSKYFLYLPAPIRTFVYVLIAVAFIHNYLAPTIMEGQLWIRDEGGENKPGENYELRHGGSAFDVNCEGRWVLTSKHKLPGKSTVAVVNPEGCLEGYVTLPILVPIYSAMYPQQYSITRKAHGDFTLKLAEGIQTGTFNVAFAASGDADRGESGPYVKIKKLQLKEAGDSKDRSGELYFKVEINGKDLEDTGLPEKKYRNKHLLLSDDTTTIFENLGFHLPRPMSDTPESEQVIEIRIYDYDYFGSDDKVGHFRIMLDAITTGGPRTYMTEELKERRWPHDNSSIEVEVR